MVHNDLVYSATGLGGGGLVRLKADKDGVTAEEVYFERRLPTSIGGAIVLGKHLYGTNGQQGLMCVELASGKEEWSNASVGAASLCYADGRLYLHGENNDVALVEADPQAYREHGRFTLPDQPKHLRGKGETAWSYPVVANGRLYLHDVGTLWCYDVQATKASK